MYKVAALPMIKIYKKLYSRIHIATTYTKYYFVLRFQIKLETDKTFINLAKDGECATCLGKCIHGVYQCKGGCFYDSKKRVMRHFVYLNWCAPFVSAIMHELIHVIGKQKAKNRITQCVTNY